MPPLISDKDYIDLTWKGEHLDLRTFENCSFTNCDLSGSHLHGSRFLNCSFRSCDLSNTSVNSASFVDVTFTECLLVGIQFSEVNPLLFKLSCQSSKLDFSSFNGMVLKRSDFIDCSLRGVDLRLADLREAKWLNCDWSEVEFEYSDLRGLDLSHERNLVLDPSLNKVLGLKLSRHQVDKVLNYLGIKLID